MRVGREEMVVVMMSVHVCGAAGGATWKGAPVQPVDHLRECLPRHQDGEQQKQARCKHAGTLHVPRIVQAVRRLYPAALRPVESRSAHGVAAVLPLALESGRARSGADRTCARRCCR